LTAVTTGATIGSEEFEGRRTAVRKSPGQADSERRCDFGNSRGSRSRIVSVDELYNVCIRDDVAFRIKCSTASLLRQVCIRINDWSNREPDEFRLIWTRCCRVAVHNECARPVRCRRVDTQCQADSLDVCRRACSASIAENSGKKRKRAVSPRGTECAPGAAFGRSSHGSLRQVIDFY